MSIIRLANVYLSLNFVSRLQPVPSNVHLASFCTFYLASTQSQRLSSSKNFTFIYGNTKSVLLSFLLSNIDFLFIVHFERIGSRSNESITIIYNLCSTRIRNQIISNRVYKVSSKQASTSATWNGSPPVSNWRTRAHSMVKTGPFQPLLSSFLARSPFSRPVFPSLSLAIFPLRTVHLLDAHSTQKACRFQISVPRRYSHSAFSSPSKSFLLFPSRLRPTFFPFFRPVSIFTMERSRTTSSLSSTYARNGNSFLYV